MERSSGTRINEVVEISQVTFRVAEMDDVVPTSNAIKRIMSQRHEQEDFAIVVPLELLEQARTTRLMFMTFMGLIAAISLVVGGIGIMNIMLATVTSGPVKSGFAGPGGQSWRHHSTVPGRDRGAVSGRRHHGILIGLGLSVGGDDLPRPGAGLVPLGVCRTAVGRAGN